MSPGLRFLFLLPVVAVSLFVHDLECAQFVSANLIERDVDTRLQGEFQVDSALQQIARRTRVAGVEHGETAPTATQPFPVFAAAARTDSGVVDIVRLPVMPAVEAADFDSIPALHLTGTEIAPAQRLVDKEPKGGAFRPLPF